MQRFVRTLSAALCALLVFTAAHAQPPAAPPAPLDKAARTTVVEAAARALKEGYVFPDVGRKAAQALEDSLAEGRYDSLTEAGAFAQRLSDDLAAVTHDKHLRVRALGGPPPLQAGPAPQRSESGVVRSDLLAGNIGYIEIIGFPAADVFRGPLDRAMAGLAGTRALIIDARRHHGGSPDAEAYLIGYLLPKGAAPVVADRFVSRTRGTEDFTTLDFTTSPTPFAYAGKPVYVLTSGETFSGGEALAYELQALHRATLVGETTGGGANPGGGVPLGAGLVMFLPTGRSQNPLTGTNWEGVGVKPDIAVPAADALKVTLQRLGRKPAAVDIDMLSKTRLFTPRSTQQPGSEAAVRRIIGENQRGEPDYTLQTSGIAEATRAQLPQLKAMFAQLGALESVSFVEVDLDGTDVYDAKFANGALRIGIVLTADGKVASIGASPAGRPPAQ